MATPTSQPDRIGVILPSWVGDAAMATPALRALRETYRDTNILFLGRAAPLEALDGSGLADETMVDTSHYKPRWRNLWRQKRLLRQARCDWLLLLPNSFRSALLARLAGAKRRIGYARDGRGWLLTDRVPAPKDGSGAEAVIPAIDYYADLVGAIGVEVTDRTMVLGVSDAGESRAETLLTAQGRDADRPLVMLNPGGSFGPSKLWPAVRYAALADTLVDKVGAQIIVNAAPGEEAVAGALVNAMTHEPLLDLSKCDNSLSLLKSLLSRCDLLVSNDTGARHIGAAMGTGVVTIFGSTDPARTPIGYDRERLIVTDADCAPCQQKQCPRTGPTHHQCMERIGVDRVLAAAVELLSQGGPR